jgi:hypothetical protein
MERKILDNEKELFPVSENVTKEDVSKIIENTEIEGLIKKYMLSIVTKDGKEGLIPSKKPSSSDIEKIKKYRLEIIDTIKAKKKAIAEAEENRKKQEAERKNKLIESGVAKLALVFSGSYQSDVEIWYVMDATDKESYQDWCREQMRDYVKLVYTVGNHNNIAKEIHKNRKSDGMLRSEGVCYYLTDEEAKAIKAEDTKEKDAKKALEEEIVKNDGKRVEEIFTKARETGEKQILSSTMCECNDKSEECSTDIVTVYAMPDGTTKTNRQHTW